MPIVILLYFISDNAFIHDYDVETVSVSSNTDYCNRKRTICSPVTRVFVHHFKHMIM